MSRLCILRPDAVMNMTCLRWSIADVPLLKELGIEIDMGPWLGFLAPSGTPADIVNKLNAAITATIAEPQVAETMRKMAMVIEHMTPDAYQRFYFSEFDRWGTYIRTAKITLDSLE
jgi:tripartite-type tricarboxylate transporter receptor subunit TctC